MQNQNVEFENQSGRTLAGIIDLPSATNLDPSPYDLLAAALATVTSMPLRMYADNHDIELDSARVRVVHRRVHAQDCDDCETTGGRTDELRRTIFLQGKPGEPQRARMLEIADRRPVHRTLEGEIKVRTALAWPLLIARLSFSSCRLSALLLRPRQPC